MSEAVELFHGPGGWAEGMKLLGGPAALGVEWDAAAVATARAAGHRVLLADVAACRPGRRRRGLIASPPCPGFSRAGKGLGRRDLPRIVELAHVLQGDVPQDGWADDRSALTLEPVRWALAVEPEWIALEQVPDVLPVWEALGDRLRGLGYSVWTGLVFAERYGVPQTRTRAVLIASRVRGVGEPVATHQRYYPPGHRARDMPSMDEMALPRWVSMAQALGWGMTERPYPVVASSRTTGGPDKEKVGGGSAARAVLYREQAEGRWMVQNARSGATVRHEGEPAPTITAGHDHAERSWVFDRPATTVAGDPRVWAPGDKVNADDLRRGHEHYQERRGDRAIRVSIEEAAVLQSFRPDYPWQGTKTKRFQQVGNAVPPLLAAAVLREAIGL
jgi:DNA (cytosine-5)-methyltransferase 1